MTDDWRTRAKPAFIRPRADTLVVGELPCLCSPNPFQCVDPCPCVGCGCSKRYVDALPGGVKKRLRHHQKLEAKLRAKPGAEAKRAAMLAAEARENSWSELAPALLKAVRKRERTQRIVAEAREANGLNTGITLALRLGRGFNTLARTARAESGKRATERSKIALGMLAAQLEVTLTRISPSTRPLDDDNLDASLKGTRDQVAAWFGIDDGDPRVKFIPAQERGPWGVRIEARLVSRAR